MLQFSHYSPETLPLHFKWQILSFFRMKWPEGFQNDNQFRDWIHPTQDAPIHLILTQNDTLIAHTSILHRKINGFSILGLSGFIVYPEFQNQGYGSKLLQTAYKFISEQKPDLSLFHCQANLSPFYAKNGWSPYTEIKNLFGNSESPQTSSDILIAQFFNNKAKAILKNHPMGFYFGQYLW